MKFAICLIVSCLYVGLINAENKWKIIETEAHFDEQVKNAGNVLIVVEFFAQWCGPCKVITPALNKLAQKYDNVIMLKMNVDENIELAARFKVTSMPTFVFLRNSETQEYFAGADLRRVEKTIVKFNN
ncbi:thioredoxin-2-like [Sitodiplosis mosellana]|uniref:thioredoxin-2-like n=1 Tax=Sitodiplosis mosellana TaxID=263140 RepID=UPI0024445A87|nr:thioredoxin-2-like [Sitodiplosis mosellana]